MSFLPSIHLIAPRVHRFWKRPDFVFFSILLLPTLTLSLRLAITAEIYRFLSPSFSEKKRKKRRRKEQFNSKIPCFNCHNKIRVSFPLNFQLDFSSLTQNLSSLTQNLSQGYGVNSIALGSNC